MSATPPPDRPAPTDRELEILKVLWEQGERTVRQVHAALSQQLPIVQNTVQAFLRTMDDKGLVTHRLQGRSFVYQAAVERAHTEKSLLSGMIDRVFDGAMDQLVESAFAVRRPTHGELQQLKALLAEVEANTEEQA